MKWTDYILLKKEAHLFDSKLYILKAFLAVVVTYAIANQLEFVKKDMISVLFGLLLTLEPVTMTGIRSGLRQIYATILGALCTAIIISFLGINIWTIALSISATLFLCLKINWREVSPVAIFTSIYMTQFIQLTTDGNPSVFLTFKLRILALGIGVFSAIIFNLIFSLISYKKMERKRIAFILASLSGHLSQIREGVRTDNTKIIQQEKHNLPQTFNGIDWLSSLIKDKEKEATIMDKLRFKSKYSTLIQLESMLLSIRSINHLIYDTTYVLCDIGFLELTSTEKEDVFQLLEEATLKLNHLSQYFENQAHPFSIDITSKDIPKKYPEHLTERLFINLFEIHKYIDQMIEEI